MAGFTSPYTSPQDNTPSTNTSTPSNAGAPSSAPTSGFVPTDGWYVFGFIIFGVITANTRIGPVVVGIETIALLYQLTLLLQGK